VSQLSGFQAGLEGIQETLATHLAKAQSPQLHVDLSPVSQGLAALQETLKGQAERPVPAPQVSVDLAPVGRELKAIQATLEKQTANVPAPPPAVTVDLSPLAQTLEALRAAVEARLDKPALPPTESASETVKVAEQMSAGLLALRESLSAALNEVHSGAMGRRLESLNEDITAVYNTLETLKDLAREQSVNLRAAQDLLTARAKQGTVEIELTQDMLTNERLFLERVHQMLSEREQRQKPAPPLSGSGAPPPLPPK
jgi:hypothetical protein